MPWSQSGVVHESAERSSRPAVVTIGVERSGLSAEAKSVSSHCPSAGA